MFRRLPRWAVLFFAITYCIIIAKSTVNAQTIQSSNYRFDESSISSGSLIQSTSANYQASETTGDLVVGNTKSGNYQIETGSQTTPDPALSFTINSGDINFGDFSTTSTATTSANFSISNYTSYGYAVQIIGNPPSNGSHVITAMPLTASPQIGTEQFGINLVANTIPSSLGANPNNGQFGFGIAAANYSTSNKYRYVSGETIAQAPKSSGITAYTISYIVNVTSLTPGGKYTTNQTLLVTGVY